jgi:hypothetical protein
MDKFFTIINRINQILFLLVLLGIAGLIVWIFSTQATYNRRGAVKAVETQSGTARPVLLKFGAVDGVRGTDALMVRLSSEAGSGGKFSSGAYTREVRNVLFLTHTDSAGHWLFKDHHNLIDSVDQLVCNAGKPHDEAPTCAVYLEYIAADSNHDGELNAEDDSTVAVSRPDGTGLTEILHGAGRVLSHQMTDAQHLSVLYQVGSQVKHLRYSLATMKVESDQTLADVPNRL